MARGAGGSFTPVIFPADKRAQMRQRKGGQEPGKHWLQPPDKVQRYARADCDRGRNAGPTLTANPQHRAAALSIVSIKHWMSIEQHASTSKLRGLRQNNLTYTS